MAKSMVALLGRRDEPTDGVADYCSWLGGAMQLQACALSIERVEWVERGWTAALSDLQKRTAAWRDHWVLLQYTNLAWSRRGFPRRVPKILSILRAHGARCAVMFHDFGPSDGTRPIDRARAFYQLQIVRRLYIQADRAIFPVPLELISWLPQSRSKAVFIPVGANCPSVTAVQTRNASTKTIVIHSVTGGNSTAVEIADIACAVKKARCSTGPLRVVVMGRGSREADGALRAEFAGTDVAIETMGLLPAELLSRTMAKAHVLLFARGQISSRRGSALAAIACGLPVVCYAGPETSGPITEAGIVSAPLHDREALSAALERVLSDDSLREALAERSRHAQQKYFSWPVIAAQFVAALNGSSQPTERVECNVELNAVDIPALTKGQSDQ